MENVDCIKKDISQYNGIKKWEYIIHLTNCTKLPPWYVIIELKQNKWISYIGTIVCKINKTFENVEILYAFSKISKSTLNSNTIIKLLPAKHKCDLCGDYKFYKVDYSDVFINHYMLLYYSINFIKRVISLAGFSFLEENFRNIYILNIPFIKSRTYYENRIKSVLSDRNII